MKEEVRLSIRIERELREKLRVAAIKGDDTVQNIVTNLIENYLREVEESGDCKAND